MLELLSQPEDLNVDAAVIDVLVHAGRLEELLPIQRALRCIHERAQEGVFALRQGDRRVTVLQATRAAVERPSSEPNHRRLVIGPDRGTLAPSVEPPQHDPDARQQLAQAERLGEVIVGSEFESDHPVDLIATMSGGDDDREVGSASQFAQEVEAVLLGQAEIENDETEAARCQQLTHLDTIGRTGHVDIILRQKRHDHLPHGWIVVHDENANGTRHLQGASSKTGAACVLVAAGRSVELYSSMGRAKAAAFALAGLLLLHGVATAQTALQDEPITAIPNNPPANPQRVALGARLFSDPGLSSSGKISCASCHDLRTNGASEVRFDQSASGMLTTVNTPTVFNATLSFRLDWRGNVRSLEEQADTSLRRRDIMSSTPAQVMAALGTEPGMMQLFRSAYGRPPDWASVLDALATFERTLLTPDSRFDLWLKGDRGAMSGAELAGYRLFKVVGCVSCHQGAGIGGNLFEVVGVIKPGLPDSGKTFRVASLRNVAATAPYFHDGSAATLQKAVRRMASGQLGLTMSDADVASIVAFLDTLDGRIAGHIVSAPR